MRMGTSPLVRNHQKWPFFRGHSILQNTSMVPFGIGFVLQLCPQNLVGFFFAGVFLAKEGCGGLHVEGGMGMRFWRSRRDAWGRDPHCLISSPQTRGRQEIQKGEEEKEKEETQEGEEEGQASQEGCCLIVLRFFSGPG